jgi:Na+/H+ antiporter NhaD/arsenite permease-like protein
MQSLYPKNINLIWTLFLLRPLHLLPFLLLRLVKASILVTRKIRRRRKKILRRRKISKGEINQLLFMMLGVLMMLENLPAQVIRSNSLAIFVRVNTFLDISLVFPRS